jgi:tetratricopeptide (TPR) repeat protein
VSFRIFGSLTEAPFSKAVLGFWFVLLIGSVGTSGAQAQPGAAASASAGAPAAPAKRLPELPRAPEIALLPPKPEELAEVDDRLAKITDPDPNVRDTAIREILEIDTQLVAAIRFRLNKLAETEDREAMKRALLAVRREARDDLRDEARSEGKGAKVETPDYLVMLSRYARPKERPWVAVTRVVALSRMLERIGTVEAVRGLVELYARYGEFLRVDTQLALSRLGDKAIAGLIEARRHPAEKISSWAGRQLDAIGKAIPSEAVQTQDQQVLADVLRAYGRIRDPDAARIVVSFAGTDRGQVREAARQAIALLGETGNWQLRDAYENVVGKRPARDWSWDRTARELFYVLDRLRSAEVDELFDKGQKAEAEGDLEKARAAFDQVLALNPLFERRDEMVGAYWEYGRRFGDERRSAAVDALKRAERLAEGTPAHDKILSLRLTLEAEERLERGVADRTLVRKALELDGENERAKELSERFARPDPGDRRESTRFTAALTIGLVSLLGIAWVLLRRAPSPAEPRAPETKPEGEPEAGSEPTPETEAPASKPPSDQNPPEPQPVEPSHETAVDAAAAPEAPSEPAQNSAPESPEEAAAPEREPRE